MIRVTRRFLIPALAACAAMATPSAHAAQDDLLLVSSPLAAPFALDGHSGSPSVSADGRYVAFRSAATNLVPGDANGKDDVFVKDLATGAVDLVSRSSAGVQGDDDAYSPSISADGRYVAFTSGADNLVSGVTSGVNQEHVFLRDRQQGTTVAVDRTIGGVIGTGSASNPSISANGRKVAFISISHNLAAGVDNQSVVDAYVKNLETSEITLISRASGPSGTPSNGTTSEVSISADGTQAAFVTTADNLGTAGALKKVYRRGTVNDAPLTLVSRVTGSNGAAADADAERPAISGDGDVVAFQTAATNLNAADTNGKTDVYARTVGASLVALVSRTQSQGVGDDLSHTPSISDDGRRVAFVTYADNMGPDDNDNAQNVYVRDRTANTSTYVSRQSGPAGAAAQQNSDQADIAGSGRWVAFRGQGGNLSDVDSDAHTDVFSRDVLGGPPFVAPPQDPVGTGDPQGGAQNGGGGAVVPPKPGPAQPASSVAFRLLGLRASRARFAARRGTRITLRATKPARVTLTLKRKRGKRWVTVGRARRTTKGTLTLTVRRRFAGKRLVAGRYRLTAELRDPATGRLLRSRALALRVTR